MRKGILFWLVLAALLGTLSGVKDLFAEEAVISGAVSGSSGAIEGAWVLVEVVAWIEKSGLRSDGYWGTRRFVRTDSEGKYQAVITVPEEVPSRYRYARCVVAKPAGTEPLYAHHQEMVPLPDPIPPKGYSADFYLQTLTEHTDSPYGAFVHGTVRDAKTSERLRGLRVEIIAEEFRRGIILWTDSDGEFFGMLPLVKSLTERHYFRVPFGGEVQITYNGLIYEPAPKDLIEFTSGETYHFDFELARRPVQTVIFGRVIEADTGRPIPNALVETDQLPEIRSVTDYLGRYQLKLHVMDPKIPVSTHVSTNGIIGRPGDPSPYVFFREYVWNVPAGEQRRLDIELRRRE